MTGDKGMVAAQDYSNDCHPVTQSVNITYDMIPCVRYEKKYRKQARQVLAKFLISYPPP